MPSFSRSISFRPYLEPLGGEPLLRWWIRRFGQRYPCVELAVVCRNAFQEREIRPLLQEGTARLVLADAGTTGCCVAAACRQARSRTVALLSLGFAYAPPDLLHRAYAHHLAFRNNWTRALGLPPGVACEIYEADLLLTLAELRLPGLPTAPGAAAAAMLDSARSAPHAPSAVRIRARPFDAAKAYDAVPQRLPEGVFLVSKRDIEVARRVLALSDASAAAQGELGLWRQASISLSLERRALPARRTAPQHTTLTASNGPRRVLFVSFPSAFSGAEQSLVQLVGSLDRQRYEPCCLVGAEGLLAERLRQAGARVNLCAAESGTGLGQATSLARAIVKVSPNVIHLNAPAGPATLLAPALLGVPVVSHIRSADLNAYASQLKASDAVIAISGFLRREALKLEIPEERVSTVYNGLRPRDFRPNALDRESVRRKFGIPDEAKVVAMVARFSPAKRHDVLLRAAQLAKARIARLILLLNGEVFGDSSCYDAVLDFVRGHRMQQWVRIVPFVEDIREIHAAADALALPSEREGFGRCVIEAMAMGVPVIVADSGALPEIVENGKSGLVVPPVDPPALAEGIVAVLSDQSLRDRLSRAGRLRVTRKFSAARTTGQVMAIYDHLLRRGGCP